MQELERAVDGVLADLARARGVPADTEPATIIVDSLDQMRFLVALEDRLDVLLDGPDVLAVFDLGSRERLMASVAQLVQVAQADGGA